MTVDFRQPSKLPERTLHARQWRLYLLKPFNQSNFAANSGPPAWKQLPTWYQISESDKMIPPDVQHTFAEKMNATTLLLNASHSSYVSYPTEIANFILNATKGK
ncbi:MAG: alpha/beta hydrolase [Nitrososphaeraceae archaeon]